MKVIYCKYGLANHYSDHIELNYHLKNNPKLKKIILEHELRHSDKFDLKHEIDPLLGLKILPFFLLHPSCWIDLFPIQYRRGHWIFDLNISLLWIIIIILILVKIWLIS